MNESTQQSTNPFIATPALSAVQNVSPDAASLPISPEPLSYVARLPTWMRNVPFIAMHLACLAVFFVSPDPLSLALCGGLYFLRMFGITAGYHRYFSHRTYKTGRVFQFFLACLGCTSMQKGPLWWAAHHREHHRHSDTPQDPHSPVSGSIWSSHIGWILSGKFDETKWQSIQDWSRYPELRWLNRLQWLPGMLLAGLCWLIAGWSGLVWGFFFSTLLLFHGTFTVNSLCHLWGKRRYDTTDDSRNNFWVALITLGEGWHNNHHHYQSSANQGFFWWEIDITYYLIRMLGWTGLVWDIRKPAPHIVAGTAKQLAPAQAVKQPVLAHVGLEK